MVNGESWVVSGEWLGESVEQYLVSQNLQDTLKTKWEVNHVITRMPWVTG